MEDAERWGWLLDQLGKPRPCALCHQEVASTQLREVWVPGARIEPWDITVQRLVWVCSTCPG